MKRAGIFFILLWMGMGLYSQSTDAMAAFQFSKAPNTAHLEQNEGKSLGLEFDFLTMTAESEGIEVTVNMFGINPVLNRWNGKSGLVLSFPFSFLSASTDSDPTLDSAGVVFAPTLGGVFKVAGELDANNLMGFGGLTLTPASILWLWNNSMELAISMPSISFHIGLKGNILLDSTFAFIPFLMVNATQAWVTVDTTVWVGGTRYFSSDSVTTPLATAPVIGFDLLIKGYSLGAMLDFKEDSTSFSLHFRIPLSQSYSEGTLE